MTEDRGRARATRTWTCSVLVACVACGASSEPPARPSPAHEVLPDVSFDYLDRDQRMELMKTSVVPAMAVAFRTHDAHRYPEVTCATCHGPGATQGRFAMPNPDLPHLIMHDIAAGSSRFKPEDLRWMTEEVTPTMARLLRAEPRGFGCASCHLVED